MANTTRIGELELIVLLAVMRLGDNAYGASIKRLLKDEIDRDVAIGALYATTERLKDKGLLTSTVGDPTPQRGGRAKNLLQVSAHGHAAVGSAKATLETLWQDMEFDVSVKGAE
ncbi:MAG: hypothetical protein R3332_10515 [Pseudohongiellaceae bacterium]|nr:hypothetical protein [Pseudohongiellaceae bacterium]